MKKLKRFFYYWRMPLIFFILFFVLLFIGDGLEGDAGGVIGAIWLFVDIPCLIIFTVRSIFLSIRSAVTYHRTGVRDEAFVFPEINFLRRVADSVSEEIDSLKELSAKMKFRYLALRLLSVLLIAAGIICCFLFANSVFLLVIFSLVIIAGATIWIVANPITYNLRIEGAQTVPFSGDITVEQLSNALLQFSTPLGAPRFANVRGFKKPVIVYGSSSDSYIYVVYRARFSDIFYVSTLSSVSLNEESDESDSQADDDNHIQDYAYYLFDITSAVEEAVSSLEAD